MRLISLAAPINLLMLPPIINASIMASISVNTHQIIYYLLYCLLNTMINVKEISVPPDSDIQLINLSDIISKLFASHINKFFIVIYNMWYIFFIFNFYDTVIWAQEFPIPFQIPLSTLISPILLQ